MMASEPGINGIVVVESPFKSDGRLQYENIVFARNVCRDLIQKGYIPYASHLFFPQMLNEEDERVIGIKLGLMLGSACVPERVVFALRENENMTEGMREAAQFWKQNMDETGYPNTMCIARYTQQGEFIMETDGIMR